MKKLLIGGTRFIVDIKISDNGNNENNKIWFNFHNWRVLLGEDFSSNLAISLTISENLPSPVFIKNTLVISF